MTDDKPAPDRRSGDRRVADDPRYPGPERREGDRRTDTPAKPA